MKHKKALFALAQILITVFNIETSFATNSKEISTNNWVRYEDYKVKINAPEKWRIERDLYGMSIMVLGPERGEERAVLSVQETPLHNFQFDFKLIEKTKDEYYVGRKKFIGELDDAYYLKDLPFKRLSGKNGNSGFEMGFQYRARDLTIEEKSIQLVCGERLFLLKSLTNEKTPTEDLKALENIVNQFECGVATLNDGEYSPSPLYNFAEKFEKAARAGFPWPTKNDFKEASLDSKVATVSSLVNFYKEYEEAGGNDLGTNQLVPTPKIPILTMKK